MLLLLIFLADRRLLIQFWVFWVPDKTCCQQVFVLGSFADCFQMFLTGSKAGSNYLARSRTRDLTVCCFFTVFTVFLANKCIGGAADSR